MPTGAEEAVGVAAIAGVVVEMADKLSNAVQGIDTIVNWAKAQEGLTYNQHVFSLDNSNSTTNSGATAAMPSAKGKPASLANQGSANPQIPREFNLLELKIDSAVAPARANFQIVLASFDSKSIGFVRLIDMFGFDTSVGSQADINFDGADVEKGHLITFKGFVNRIGIGFAHFSGSVLFDYTKKTTSFVCAEVVPRSEGTPYFPGNMPVAFKF